MYNDIWRTRQTIEIMKLTSVIAILLVLFGISLSERAYAIECRAKIAPQVNVKPMTRNVQYDFTKTKAELNSFDVDTISPYGPQHKTQVSGLMSGSIQTKSQVELLHEKYALQGKGCLYLKSANVTISIDPTIFVAKEYKKGSCYHNAVLNHERKHVQIGRAHV